VLILKIRLKNRIMLITRTVTKKILETIVHETFSNLGVLVSSSLLDSLKLLGFYYATTAGISINIEDLKTPDIKKEIIKKANEEIVDISQQWEQGFVSDTERFQSIIDSWNIATESLKNRIVDYYQLFDPANNLYIMAFSGARGNMSQVRQLVGMRGLMSDQEGKIIDLPIQANFREGLSSIDYIISSYGARKGIVDTALKTADSGYLTRRLIYLAQDLIIREFDCRTKSGLIVFLNKKTNTKNLVGRNLINARRLKYPYDIVYDENLLLEGDFLKELKQTEPFVLKVRSSLTCKVNGSVCQKCYGWDLSREKLISLGEAVGIIAAQSIGEPGTQLTMRTFHTGGIFTSETVKQIVSPFSGKLIIPASLKTISYRTSHGTMVLKLQQEAILSIINWKGIQKRVFLVAGSYLYLNSSSFVKKGQIIAEYSTQTSLPSSRRLRPIYTSMGGEIRFENLLVRKLSRDKRTIKVNQDDGVLWIASGKIFPVPNEIKYLFPKILNKTKPFAKLKLVTPYQGIAILKDETITIVNQKTQIVLDLVNLEQVFQNCLSRFSPTIKNYQYVDQFTILSYMELFGEYEGRVYSVRKKEAKYITTFFLITESDVWKINSDHINDFSFFQDKKTVIRAGNLLNTTSKFSRSGFFLKKDGFKMIFQTVTPLFLSRGTILNYKQGDFVVEKKIFAMLVNYTQQTEDIVQGLPKIEELVEARRPKIKSYLSYRPGVFLNFRSNEHERILKDSIIKCISKKKVLKKTKKTKKAKKSKKIEEPITDTVDKNPTETINIGHSLYLKDEILVYNNRVFKAVPVPSIFQPNEENPLSSAIDRTTYFVFLNLLQTQPDDCYDEDNWKRKKKNEILLIDNNFSSSTWQLKTNLKETYIYKQIGNELIQWAAILQDDSFSVFENVKKDLIIKTKEFEYLFLEYLHPLIQYEIPLTSKVLYNPGDFVDIGEPITEGILDVHELLSILFKYHSILDGTMIGTIRCLSKLQLLLVNSIQSIYQSQGVNISSKHIEIIVRQMTAKVIIRQRGDTPLLPGELLRLSLLNEIYQALKVNENIFQYKTPEYEPILLSATSCSLSKDGFLSPAGFQETKRVLTKAALEGASDWLRGLKECIIIGRLIPAGSSFLNYKSYLDNIYSFKD
jgi:hypothetical protein